MNIRKTPVRIALVVIAALAVGACNTTTKNTASTAKTEAGKPQAKQTITTRRGASSAQYRSNGGRYVRRGPYWRYGSGAAGVAGAVIVADAIERAEIEDAIIGEVIDPTPMPMPDFGGGGFGGGDFGGDFGGGWGGGGGDWGGGGWDGW